MARAASLPRCQINDVSAKLSLLSLRLARFFPPAVLTSARDRFARRGERRRPLG